jgi:APA family basic amino acid/polyamine antiporter
VPWVSESNYLIQPIRLGGYAISLSTAQLVGLLLIALLTFMNTLGLKLGKIVQNIFTTAKTGALIALILLGIVVGSDQGRARRIFPISGVCVADCKKLERVSPRQLDSDCSLASASRKRTRSFLLMRGTISLYRRRSGQPRRNVPLSLAFGTILVISLYCWQM